MNPILINNRSIQDSIHLVHIDEYHKMNENGLLSNKTELIEGLIIDKMTKSPLHSYILSKLVNIFNSKISNEYWIRQELPLTLPNSEPEPDISILKGRIEDYKTRHPSIAEVVIEISVSSIELDRAKTNIYAKASIPEYWIVMPNEGLVEVYLKPVSEKYKVKKVLSDNEMLKTIEGIEINLKSLFE